ncbi:hypothetical protein GPALN_009721 [Globodera pallida]|nr:hypothetical protein GPALN_009721 [Globodera pallida]
MSSLIVPELVLLLTIAVLVAFTPSTGALRCLAELSDMKFGKNVSEQLKQKLKRTIKKGSSRREECAPNGKCAKAKCAGGSLIVKNLLGE